MYITIKELLESNVMKNSKVLSGASGLNRQIKRISVHDCPVQADILDRKILKTGDFIITNLFFLKSSPRMIKDFIEMLNNVGCSGICVSNQHLKELPEEVLEYSNGISFPIVQFDLTIPYADIIGTTMELILAGQEYLVNELRLEKLLSGKLPRSEVRDIAYEINQNFKDYNCVINIDNYEIKDKNQNTKAFLDYLNFNLEYSAFYYKKSLIVITTFNTENEKVIKSMIDLIIKETGKYYKEYSIGISDIHKSIIELDETLAEAIFATKNSKYFGEKVSYYSNIGINRLLLPIHDEKEMKKFYSMIIEPIKRYDEQFNSELLKTIISFVKNDGNYKKTAEEFFQHQNTIRYRIKMVKTILNMEQSEIDFYTSISLAIRIGLLLK